MENKHIDVVLTIGTSAFTFSTTKISEAYAALIDILGHYEGHVPCTPDDLMERLVSMKNGTLQSFHCSRFSVNLMEGEV